MGNLDGGCLCGNVSYKCEAEPIVTVLCNCHTCQRMHGTAMALKVGVSKSAFDIKGDTIGHFQTVGETLQQPRDNLFCTNCGSQLATYVAEYPDIVLIKA